MRPDKQARTSVDYDSGISERAWRKITSQVNHGMREFCKRNNLPLQEYGEWGRSGYRRFKRVEQEEDEI